MSITIALTVPTLARGIIDILRAFDKSSKDSFDKSENLMNVVNLIFMDIVPIGA